MPFDPRTNRFPYPVDTSSHYLKNKKDDHTVFDKDYCYLDKSKSFRFKRFFFRIVLVLIVFPMTKIRLNLKIIGRKNLKKYKDVLKNGVITVSNHVHMWDYLAIVLSLKHLNTNVLVWDRNMTGESKKLVKMIGGIPIPNTDMQASIKMSNTVKELLLNKGWLHVYSEGSMWEFYQPIRPFKEGAAYYSIKTNKPILPLAFSYRKNGFIRRKIFNSPASITVSIGEPIFPDLSKPFKEEKERLTIECHDAVCKLAFINPEDNIYPKIYNNSKRIDYYTNEYGIGYKKSR